MQRKSRVLEDVIIIAVLLVILGFAVVFFLYPRPIRYIAPVEAVAVEAKPKVAHVSTPVPVKAIYMSQCASASRSFREKLVKLINDTELNSVVLDIKDYSGRISYISEEPMFKDATSHECYATDMKEFIESMHKDGIYVIGRVTVFQDPHLAKERPDLAVKFDSNKEKNWTDRKGIQYIDPGAREAWEYVATLSLEAYEMGFDEINFDYIRFPSDGNMDDIHYPHSEASITADPNNGKVAVLEGFFRYLDKIFRAQGIPISADLFGMTTTNKDDLNIGQVLESALPYFDYVAPMVYPSHYPPNFIGLPNPAAKPYEVIKYSMDKAVERASTTPLKIRPWLQDFHLGANYTPDMVRAQIKAVYDSGLDSWMLWNASNRYTREALEDAIDI